MKIYDVLIQEYLNKPGENLDLKYNLFYKDNYKYSLNEEDEIIDNLYAIDYFYNLGEKFDNDFIFNLETELSQVLKKMEIKGVKIDREKLINIGEKLDLEIKKEEDIIYEIRGEKFNINSPKQVGELLFGKIGLKTNKKTKTGYSVDNEVLIELSKDHKIAFHINNYRQYKKLLSTYIEGFLDIIKKDTQTIHTTYSQTIASTGRLSSINPNLQNIPSSSSGYASLIREVFVSFDSENDEILRVDYSQIEVRILAILSGDSDLLGAFEKGIDIHSNTGYFLFGKDHLSSDERKIAKGVNFGVIYGISPFGLSKMIGISQKDAKEYIQKFFIKYSKVGEFFDKIIKDCESNGYVETIFGRKRYINNINDSNEIVKKRAQREAMNMPIQGTSADIIKIAMIKIDKFLSNFQSCILMQVHDELVFNIKKEEKNIVLPEIIKILENVLIDEKKFNNKLKVDYAFGKNWRECK